MSTPPAKRIVKAIMRMLALGAAIGLWVLIFKAADALFS